MKQDVKLMKQGVKIILSILLMISLCNIKVIAAANLIQNSSFEEITGDTPTGWTKNAWDKNAGSELKVETGGAHSGDKFVTIINKANNDARFSQKINVEENKIYKLSSFIKTDNIGKEGAGACISIEGKLQTSPSLKGNNGDWQLREMYAKVGKGVNNIIVTIDVGGYGNLSTGKASFDDVTVEEVSSIPQNAVVANIESKQNQAKDDSNKGSADTNKSNSASDIVRFLFGGIILIAICGAGYYIYINKFTKNKKSKSSIKESNKADDEDDLI